MPLAPGFWCETHVKPNQVLEDKLLLQRLFCIPAAAVNFFALHDVLNINLTYLKTLKSSLKFDVIKVAWSLYKINSGIFITIKPLSDFFFSKEVQVKYCRIRTRISQKGSVLSSQFLSMGRDSSLDPSFIQYLVSDLLPYYQCSGFKECQE